MDPTLTLQSSVLACPALKELIWWRIGFVVMSKIVLRIYAISMFLNIQVGWIGLESLLEI
jgi:hypothetical protein